MVDDVDVVVLGGGPGGYAAALRSAQLGLRVALVEEAKVGGVCLHAGCVPTKALLHVAEVADGVRGGAGLGIRATFEGVDLAAANAFATGVVGRLHRGLEGLVRSRGIEVIEGRGTITDATSVEVVGRAVTGRFLVAATGATPRALSGVPFDGRRVLSSDHALSLERLPRTAIVVGGGVVGCEFASMWRSMGSDVTIVESQGRLLSGEEPASSNRVEQVFRRRGIELRLGAGVGLVAVGDDAVRVTLADGAELEAEVLLVAVGRDARTTEAGLDAAGVVADAGRVVVDEWCRTNVAGIYAVGDLVGPWQLAHAGFAQGMLAAEHMAGLEPATIDYDGVPRVTYCDPQVVAVGLTSAEAEARGIDVITTSLDLAGNAMNRIHGGSGTVTIVAERDGPVRGVHVVGPRVADLAGEMELIVNWEALPSDVAGLIHAHPTISEGIGEAFLAASGRALHSHG